MKPESISATVKAQALIDERVSNGDAMRYFRSEKMPCVKCGRLHKILYADWDWQEECNYYLLCPKAGKLKVIDDNNGITFTVVNKGGWFPKAR